MFCHVLLYVVSTAELLLQLSNQNITLDTEQIIDPTDSKRNMPRHYQFGSLDEIIQHGIEHNQFQNPSPSEESQDDFDPSTFREVNNSSMNSSATPTSGLNSFKPIAGSKARKITPVSENYYPEHYDAIDPSSQRGMDIYEPLPITRLPSPSRISSARFCESAANSMPTNNALQTEFHGNHTQAQAQAQAQTQVRPIMPSSDPHNLYSAHLSHEHASRQSESPSFAHIRPHLDASEIESEYLPIRERREEEHARTLQRYERFLKDRMDQLHQQKQFVPAESPSKFAYNGFNSQSLCPQNAVSFRSLLKYPRHGMNDSDLIQAHNNSQKGAPPTASYLSSYFSDAFIQPRPMIGKAKTQPHFLPGPSEDLFHHDDLSRSHQSNPYLHERRNSLPQTNIAPFTASTFTWENFAANEPVNEDDDENRKYDPRLSKFNTEAKKCESLKPNKESGLISTQGVVVRALLNSADRVLVTAFTYEVMSELEIVTFATRDRRGNRGKTEIGFPGLACRYCKGCSGRTGRYFPSSIRTLADSKKTLFTVHRHLASCSHCPPIVKRKLGALFSLHSTELKEKCKRHGSQRAFYRIIWETMHPLGQK